MKSRRYLCLALSFLLGFPSLALYAQTDLQTQASRTQYQETVLSASPEGFRSYMIDFLHDLDAALTGAMQHPRLGAQLAPHMIRTGIQVPFAPALYETLETATVEELAQIQANLSRAPGFLLSPALITSALELLAPPAEETALAAGVCGSNYVEFQSIRSRKPAIKGLVLAADGIAFALSITNTLGDAIGAATEDVPFVGKLPALPVIIIAGILDVTVLAIRFAASELTIQVENAQLCIDACLLDTNNGMVGRGCDNRDNNCTGGIDESAEDRFSPSIRIDSSLIGRCFRGEQEARDAVDLAVKASDDCSEITPVVQFSVNSAACLGILTAQAEDDAGNSVASNAVQLVVDANPPQIFVPPLLECYASLAAARAAFTAIPVIDCTDVHSEFRAVEKECVADLELRATDECGNRSTATATVRLDGAAPVVNIERLLIPTIDGLSCFSSRDDAIAAVREATSFSDNCTSSQDLIVDTTATGDDCNLTVTSTAMDACGRFSSDSLLVRVDKEPPVISCSVQIGDLSPADSRMQDVGLALTVSDNCDGTQPDLAISVTSDEPTAIAFSVIGDDDPYPDAVVERGADGSIQRVLLRAQRRGSGDYDGRVYRIRVTATDSCGLSARTDCYVTVPSSKSDPSTAVNSGQNFDATEIN